MVGSRQAIEAVPAQPPGYSLLAAVQVLDSGGVWAQGTEWAPEQLGQGGAVAVDCFGSTPDGFEASTAPVINTADPFAVYATDVCSTFGWQARDYEGRARRQLAAVRSARIALEFQLGSIRDAKGLGNPALKDATVVLPSAVPVQLALAELEQKLGTVYLGRQAMIHVSPFVFTLMQSAFLISLQAQKWKTALGTIVVTDAGYRAEADGGQYMYGTPVVQVRLGDVMLVPGTLEEARAQATDRATNLTTIHAEQLVLVQVDNAIATRADAFFKVGIDTELSLFS